MTIAEIVDKLGLKVVCGQAGLNREVTGAYVSDLLSDVMGFAQEGQLWITLQTHKNVIAIASLKEIPAILLVKGFQPSPECAAQSELEQIPVLSTDEATFEISGRLYSLFRQ